MAAPRLEINNHKRATWQSVSAASVARMILTRSACFSLVVLAVALTTGCNKSDKADDSASEAQGVGSAEPGKHKHELPQAAFDACTGKAAGDACTAQFGDKQIEAKCAAAPDGRLACLPERGEHKKPD